MTHETTCKVDGCKNSVHAKGYCRKHYGQIWRKGKVQVQQETNAPRQTFRRSEETERMRALEREFRRAELMYNNVVGLEGRLKWRREIVELKKEMTRMGMQIPTPLPETGHQTQKHMDFGF